MKIESILVLVDGSEQSDSAVEMSVAIASAVSARIDFISIIDSTGAANFGSVSEVDDNIMAAGTGRIMLDQAEKKAKAAGVACSTQVLKGVPYLILSDLSRGHDLMVLAIDGWDDGTFHDDKQAAKAAMESSCPVLTVGAYRDRLDRILLAVHDGNEGCIDLAARLAKCSKAQLRIISVGLRDDEAGAAVSKAAERCREDGVEAETETAKGAPIKIVSEISKGYDLLVFDADGHRGLALDVMLRSNCPVLLVGDWSKDRE